MRVVIAEDLFLLRDGIARLLQAHGCDIVAAVGDGPALVEALIGERPDVAIVDVRLPPTFTDERMNLIVSALSKPPAFSDLQSATGRS